MKKVLVLAAILVLLVVSAPAVVGGQQTEPPLSEPATALVEEEARLEHLQAEETRLENLLRGAMALVERVEVALTDAGRNPGVALQEFQNFYRAGNLAVEARNTVQRRLEMFRQEIAGAEENIARLKRAVVIYLLEAEALRIEEAASGK